MNSAPTWAVRSRRTKSFSSETTPGYYYNTATAPNLITVPSLAARQGDFTGSLPIYDPNTQVCNGADLLENGFPGNMIPPDRISPAAKSFQSYLPTPTNGNITNNYPGEPSPRDPQQQHHRQSGL